MCGVTATVTQPWACALLVAPFIETITLCYLLGLGSEQLSQAMTADLAKLVNTKLKWISL